MARAWKGAEEVGPMTLTVWDANRCGRCGGLMVPAEPETMRIGDVEYKSAAWRCLSCGLVLHVYPGGHVVRLWPIPEV